MPVTRAFDAIRGMQTDPPIDQMPNNAMRRIVDFLPEFQFVLQARGGWDNLTGVLAAPGTGTRKYASATYCPFTNGAVIALTQLNHLGFTYVNALDGSTTGFPTADLAEVPLSPPTFHLTPSGGLLIIPTVLGPQKWNGSGSPSALGGSPPQGRLVASWGDYLLIANTSANPNRLWFSPVGNPDGASGVNWNTGAGGSFVDFPEAIRAVVPKGNTIFVFGASYCHLLLGDTPPPGGNMTQRKYALSEGVAGGVWGYGVTATLTYKDYVIWANGNGIWKSDGGQPVDLTKLGGIKSYWPFIFQPKPAGQTLAIGTYRSYLIITILTSAKAFNRCVVYDLENNTWWEWSNIPATSLTRIPSGTYKEDLLIVDYANNKLGSIASIFNAGNEYNDGNATQKAPSILTGMYRFGVFGQKRIRRAFISGIVQNGNTLQAGFLTPDALPASGSDPASYVPTPLMKVVISGSGTNANKNLRVPYHIDRKAELIQAYITGYGGVGISGLDMEVAEYDLNRDGDAR